jgi:hypothetical protein
MMTAYVTALQGAALMGSPSLWCHGRLEGLLVMLSLGFAGDTLLVQGEKAMKLRLYKGFQV